MKQLMTLVLSFFMFGGYAQNAGKVIKKLGDEPLFYVDSEQVTKSSLKNIQPEDIATVTIYKDSNAIRIAGPDGKDGLVYIETKAFARKKYQHFLSTRSGEYARLISGGESDTAIQYILNKKVLKDNFEGDLSNIDDATLKSINLIDPETLQKSYGVTGKHAGVVIITEKSTGTK